MINGSTHMGGRTFMTPNINNHVLNILVMSTGDLILLKANTNSATHQVKEHDGQTPK
jgi:hypothetical protein